MMLQGKGFWIWQLYRTDDGNPTVIANRAQSAGLTHVPIKIADGAYGVNIDSQTGQDQVLPVVKALHAKGIQAWGWQYIYGRDWEGKNIAIQEANRAIERIRATQVDGFIVDAEKEYKQTGSAALTIQYMFRLREEFPTLPVALSTYRFPSYHPTFPYSEFLTYCDLNMPQVYWEQSTNAGSQLKRSISEYQKITPFREIIPTGPTYSVGKWKPTESQILEFLNTAKELNLKGANFFSWQECLIKVPELWTTIANYSWSGTPQLTLPEKYINALNLRDIQGISSLYQNNAVHITASQTIVGMDNIRNWYVTFLNQVLPNGLFTLTGSTCSTTSCQFTWQATSSAGNILNGSDSIGLKDGKIVYHYSFFKVTPP